MHLSIYDALNRNMILKTIPVKECHGPHGTGILWVDILHMDDSIEFVVLVPGWVVTIKELGAGNEPPAQERVGESQGSPLKDND